MHAPAISAKSQATHNSEAEQLYNHLTGLASLAAFPVAKLPGDMAASLGAAARAAQERIGELLPRYCGFGLGEVVDVADKPAGVGAARVESIFINEAGSASILLRAVAADGTDLDQHLQFPLFYARCAMAPSDLAPADAEETLSTPAP